MKKLYCEPNAVIEMVSRVDVLTESGDITVREGFTLPVIWESES